MAEATAAAGKGGAPKGKVCASADEALRGVVADGQTLAVGGFGLCGIPEALIAALRDSGVTGLTVISNNAGVDGFGLGQLLGDAPDPQDDFVLRRREQGIRAPVPGRRTRTGIQPAGHAGRAPARRRRRHPGVLHRAPATAPSSPKARRCASSTASITCMETALKADVSLVKAWKADTSGNLVFRKTARNFNPAVRHGRQGLHRRSRGDRRDRRTSIPTRSTCPGIYVDRIVHNPHPEKRIEQRTVRAQEAQ